MSAKTAVVSEKKVEDYLKTEEVPDTVNITTSDGKTLIINWDIIENCGVIKNAAIYDKTQGFPLPNVDAECMRLIIDFFNIYFAEFPRKKEHVITEVKTKSKIAPSNKKSHVKSRSSTQKRSAKPVVEVGRRKPLRTDQAAIFCYQLNKCQFKKLMANASYLQCDILLDYCLMALLMRTDGCDIHKLRTMLMLPDDYTQIEEDEMLLVHVSPESGDDPISSYL